MQLKKILLAQLLALCFALPSSVANVSQVDGSAATASVDFAPVGSGFFAFSSTGTGSTNAHQGAVTYSADQNLSGLQFYSTVTLNSTKTLTCPNRSGGLYIYASTSITINGTIACNGAGKALSTQGTGGTAAGTQGGSGMAQAAGGGGGGSGGAGGQGGHTSNGFDILAQSDSSGNSVAGAGGAINTVGSNATAITGSDVRYSVYFFGGGAQGGGGGGDGTAGGNGGLGGGTIVLVAPTVTLANTCTLNSSGANGSNAAAGNRGGGGGGGAGNILIIAHTFTDNGCTFTMTGGTGGTKQGTGGNGGNGAAGVKQILIY